MDVNGVVGVLAISGPYGVCGKILDGGGPLCLNLSCLKLEMDQKCSSSSMRIYCRNLSHPKLIPFH